MIPMRPLEVPRSAVEHAIARHDGNRTAMAGTLGLSLNTIRRLINLYGLGPTADAAAASARRPGPRRRAPEEALALEREQILAALAAGTDTELPHATLYRRIAEYGITKDEVEAYRLSTRCTTGSASDLAEGTDHPM